ncbi:MAG: hydantoinase/oxoprolinase family protein [Alphaproteobacteria bacterium]|nr:hydantoinase/oxoprolinase family protein [Alphaproteobacteria bacterium]
MAIDVGGTFTDVQVLDEAGGDPWAFKTPTTPEDPARGLATAIAGAARAFGFDPADVYLLVHGTTIATNAVLERRFPKAALVTTAGFEDVLEIGRHMRRDVYGLHAETRHVLVPRPLRFGVPERIGADGGVRQPLDEAAALGIVRRIVAEAVETVAICLLNSFANPEHERRLAQLLRAEAPGLDLSISSEVSAEMREFERMSTTVLNALLMPVVSGHIERMAERLTATRLSAPVLFVQSNGGTCGPRQAARQPAHLLLSGPCGGVLAVEQIGRRLGEANLVGIDMGGTSFDVSVVRDGRMAMVTEADVDGSVVRLPMVDIRTVGAGGGSIAWVDRAGRLRVGPESAGADPGPACYGRGGREPTVTDANLVLGRISPDRFVGGAMPLDPAPARSAIETRLGAPLGLGLEAAADGLIRIALANMARTIRLSLFEKGLDPREFALVAFGGAGGLHAALMADELAMTRVIYPLNAATLSAFGLLWADIAHDLSRTRLTPAETGAAAKLAPVLAALMAEGDALLDGDRVAPAERRFEAALDMRYRGQGYEVTVPLGRAALDEGVLGGAIADFHARHRERFSHADPDAPVEVVTVRLRAGAHTTKPAAQPFTPAGVPAAVKRRPVYLDGRWQDLAILDRASIRPSEPVEGPAIVEEDYTTILLPAGWRIALLASGNLLAEKPSLEC